MNIKPLNNRLIVEIIEEPKEGSIAIPHTLRNKKPAIRGTVLLVGDGISTVVPGEVVMFPGLSGDALMKREGKELRSLSIMDVLAKETDEESDEEVLRQLMGIRSKDISGFKAAMFEALSVGSSHDIGDDPVAWVLFARRKMLKKYKEMRRVSTDEA
jgi:co-chaperonin GroES (HSP10)